jgi:hypothetical protein
MAHGARVGAAPMASGGPPCLPRSAPLGIKVTRFQIVVNVFIGHIDIGLAVCLMVRVGILCLPKVPGRRARIRGGRLWLCSLLVVKTATAGRGSGRSVGHRHACHRSRSQEARTRAARRGRPLGGNLPLSRLLLLRRQLFRASAAKEKGRLGACQGRRWCCWRRGHIRGDGACGGSRGDGLVWFWLWLWLGRTTAAKGKDRSRACRSRRCGGGTTPRQGRGRLLFRRAGQAFLVLAPVAKQSPQAPALLGWHGGRRFHGAP